jgi:hypothetical protein
LELNASLKEDELPVLAFLGERLDPTPSLSRKSAISLGCILIRRTRRWCWPTSAQIEQIKMLHAAGSKLGEIAKTLGVHHFTVLRALKPKDEKRESA